MRGEKNPKARERKSGGRRSSILKRQDSCVISEGSDGSNEGSRTPRRVSFASQAMVREFRSTPWHWNDESSSSAGSNTSLSSSSTEKAQDEVFVSASIPQAKSEESPSPNTSLTEEFLAASQEEKPHVLVQAINTFMHDVEENNLRGHHEISISVQNKTILFTDMDESLCGMDLTSNISQLSQSLLQQEGQNAGLDDYNGQEEVHVKTGLMRRPSFSDERTSDSSDVLKYMQTAPQQQAPVALGGGICMPQSVNNIPQEIQLFNINDGGMEITQNLTRTVSHYGCNPPESTQVFGNIDEGCMEMTQNLTRTVPKYESNIPESTCIFDNIEAGRMELTQNLTGAFLNQSNIDTDNSVQSLIPKPKHKLLDDLFKLVKKSEPVAVQELHDKDETCLDDDMEMTGDLTHQFQRSALLDITTNKALTPIAEMSLASTNISAADHGSKLLLSQSKTVLPYLNQVSSKLEQIQRADPKVVFLRTGPSSDNENVISDDKENCPIISTELKSHVSRQASTDITSQQSRTIHFGNASCYPNVSSHENFGDMEITECQTRTIHIVQNDCETNNDKDDPEIELRLPVSTHYSVCENVKLSDSYKDHNKIETLRPYAKDPTQSMSQNQNEPNYPNSVLCKDYSENATLHFKDTDDMEFTTTNTRTIHIGPVPSQLSETANLLKSGQANTQDFSYPYKGSEDGMELTQCQSKTIHLGSKLDVMRQNVASNTKCSSSDDLNSVEPYLYSSDDTITESTKIFDNNQMEATQCLSKAIEIGQGKIHTAVSQAGTNFRQERSYTDFDTSQMEMTDYQTKTIHVGHQLSENLGQGPIVLKNFASENGSAQNTQTDLSHNEINMAYPSEAFQFQDHTNLPDIDDVDARRTADISEAHNLDARKMPEHTMQDMAPSTTKTVYYENSPARKAPILEKHKDLVEDEEVDLEVFSGENKSFEVLSPSETQGSNSANRSRGGVNHISLKRSSPTGPENNHCTKKPKEDKQKFTTEIPQSQGDVQSNTLEVSYAEKNLEASRSNRTVTNQSSALGRKSSKNSTLLSQKEEDMNRKKEELKKSLTKIGMPLPFSKRTSNTFDPFSRRKSCKFDLLMGTGNKGLLKKDQFPLSSSSSLNKTVAIMKTSEESCAQATPPVDTYDPAEDISALMEGTKNLPTFIYQLSSSSSGSQSSDISLKSDEHPVPPSTKPLIVSASQESESITAKLTTTSCFTESQEGSDEVFDLTETLYNQEMPELTEDLLDINPFKESFQVEDEDSLLLDINSTMGQPLMLPVKQEAAAAVALQDICVPFGIVRDHDTLVKNVPAQTIPVATIKDKLGAKVIFIPKLESLKQFVKETETAVNKATQDCKDRLFHFSLKPPEAYCTAVEAMKNGADASDLKSRAQMMVCACRMLARARWKRRKADYLLKYSNAREESHQTLDSEVEQVISETERVMDLSAQIDKSLLEIDAICNEKQVLQEQEKQLQETENETKELKVQCQELDDKVELIEKSSKEMSQRLSETEDTVAAVEERLSWISSLTEWTILKHTEREMHFGFLFRSVILKIELKDAYTKNSPQKISHISFRSRITAESKPWAKLAHNMALSSIDCEKLHEKYVGVDQIGQLLSDVSTVICNCRQLSMELRMMHLKHKVHIEANRITLVIMDRRTQQKVQLMTTLMPHTYPNVPLQWSVTALLGNVSSSDIQLAVDKIHGGHKYIIQIATEVEQLLASNNR